VPKSLVAATVVQMSQPHAERNLRLLFLYWFMSNFQLWIPVWIVFLTVERGFSLTQVTSAEGLFLIGMVALEVPTGAIADRYGRSRSMGLGSLFLAVAVLIFAFTQTFSVLLASFMLWSVASTLVSGADNALLFDTLKSVGREREFERYSARGMALQWAGVGIATVLAGPVAALFDIQFTIFLGVATCVLNALVAFAMWEPPHRAEEGVPKESYLGSIRAAFREAWSVVDVRVVILLAATAFAAMEGAHYLVQPFLIDREIEVGVVFSLLQVPILGAGLVGALIVDRIAGYRHINRAFVVAPVAGAAMFGILATAPGMLAYAALPLLMAISSCVEPIASGFINRRIGSERRATVLSIASMARSVVLAGLAPLLGFATDQWGLAEAFAIGGAVALVGGLVFGLPVARRRNEPLGAVTLSTVDV